MDFRVEEQNGLMNFYPLFAIGWMLVYRGNSDSYSPWKLYKQVGEVYSYISEHTNLTIAVEAGKGL